MSPNGATDAAEPTEDKTSNKKKKKAEKFKQLDESSDRDTSNFTIEERLVAAVWFHERKLEKLSVSQIKINFRMRFGKPPPTKNTLYIWEKKIFSTGKVMDAKRSGRPCIRKAHISSVEASLKESPELSLRARAEKLNLPRSTLKKIIKNDLNHHSETRIQTNVNNLSTHNEMQCNNVDKSNKQTVIRQNNNQQMNLPCNNMPVPPPHSYPETVGIPISAFQHCITYSNDNHHQGSALIPTHSKIPMETRNHIADTAPHMINNQQHMPAMNHHTYIPNNQEMEKTHIIYSHSCNLQDEMKNQMVQRFLS